MVFYISANIKYESYDQHHIKRFDHIIKALAFLALCIHWFNPLVWLSFTLSGRDMEMSCDEAVVKKLGTEIRADYTASLLSLATGHRIIAGTPLAFGEGDTKERIKNLVNWKKPAFWVTILAVVSCSILAVCLLTNPSIRRDTLKFTGQNQRGRTYSVDFETNFGNQVKNGTIFAEQWYNGECVRSSSVTLTQYVEELHILMNIRHDGEQQSGVDIQIDTDEYGGSLLTYFAFPDDKSFIGWSFQSYGLGDKLEVTSGEERILAAMAFDDGHGVRSIDLDALVSNPEYLKEPGYMVIIRASFYDGESGSQNNEPVPSEPVEISPPKDIDDSGYDGLENLNGENPEESIAFEQKESTDDVLKTMEMPLENGKNLMLSVIGKENKNNSNYGVRKIDV